MSDREHLVLSKFGGGRPADRRSTRPGLPPVLLRLAVRRVQAVAVFVLVAMLFGWILANAVEGDLPNEFRRAGEWVPPTFMIVASAMIIALARWSRLPAPTLISVALAYEVAVSYAMVFSSMWDTYGAIPAYAIETDVVGYSAVALWMLAFTVIVPSEPRRALVALLLSAAAAPLMYLYEVNAGRAPVIDPGRYFLTFVGPYLSVAILAYISARIVYSLGQDVAEAREMGSYRLTEKLGQGGMGEVWQAEHRLLARPAAVKLIRSHAFGTDPSHAERLMARFEREAQATALLQSPHTVEVYDFGTTEDGTFYYVMELLDGVDLEQLVKAHGPLPPERVVHILRQICASLAEAHRRGMVHRDVKPANIFLCRRALEDDFVKVLDFGLVKRHETDGADDVRVSQTGTIHGTPSYLAPEVAQGDGEVDGRADLYALGCVAYWLLTGRLVFERDTYPAMLLAHATVEPSPPSAHAPGPIPPELDALVLACLAKDPSDRVPSAEAVVRALETVVVADPWDGARAAAWWASLDDR